MTVLDLRNLMTPFCLLKASNVFNGMQAGEKLEILWRDAGSSSDLLKVIPADLCDSIYMEKPRDASPGIRIHITKKKSNP